MSAEEGDRTGHHSCVASDLETPGGDHLGDGCAALEQIAEPGGIGDDDRVGPTPDRWRCRDVTLTNVGVDRVRANVVFVRFVDVSRRDSVESCKQGERLPARLEGGIARFASELCAPVGQPDDDFFEILAELGQFVDRRCDRWRKVTMFDDTDALEVAKPVGEKVGAKAGQRLLEIAVTLRTHQ